MQISTDAAVLASGFQYERAGVLAVIIISAAVVLYGSLAIYHFRHRFLAIDRQIERFSSRFDGRATVIFQPTYWSFDEAQARAIARQHQYWEAPPVMRNLLLVHPKSRAPRTPAIASLWR